MSYFLGLIVGIVVSGAIYANWNRLHPILFRRQTLEALYDRHTQITAKLQTAVKNKREVKSLRSELTKVTNDILRLECRKFWGRA